jgi:two-component system, LytTR family, response regulator
MTNIKTIIIDDEKEAREGVQRLLDQDDELEVVALCKNGVEAIQEIQTLKPDLVLLDIQMPMVNGLEVINSLPLKSLPAIIFVTAYDQYTLKAFEVHAIDYLLKPFTDERFFSALAFAKQHIRNKKWGEDQQKMEKLVTYHQQHTGSSTANTIISLPLTTEKIINNRLIVKADGRVHLLLFNDIVWIEAYDYYIKIHVTEKYFLVRDSLKKMETFLPEAMFVRIHKSSIINIRHITELATHSNGEQEVTLTSGVELKISRNYRDKLKDLL